MDAFLPGVPGWEAIYNDPSIWHFRFNGPTPEALVQGRERIYFEYFWNDLAADKTHSIPEADRRAYIAAYARPGRMHAGWAYFVSFQQAAKDFAELSQTKLTMPVLSIGGAKSLGKPLGNQMDLVATNVTTMVVGNAGHWLMEEPSIFFEGSPLISTISACFPAASVPIRASLPKIQSAILRSDLNRLHRTESRLDQQLDLPLIAESRQHATIASRIGPSQQQSPSPRKRKLKIHFLAQ